MNRKIIAFIFTLFLGTVLGLAEDTSKNAQQEKAEAEQAKGQNTSARYMYIRAFEDYAGRGQIKQGVECAVKATALYYRENLYKEGFDLLRNTDQAIANTRGIDEKTRSALRYQVARERMRMYLMMKRSASTEEQLAIMQNHANAAADESLKDDWLYNKAIFHYTFGQNEKGNAVFKEMADRLTAQKEYDKVEDVYKTLIANGRRSGSANLVAQSYKSYIQWKDSVSALKVADRINELKGQIADNETVIAEKDGTLASRQALIIGLSILAAILAAALVLVTLVLLRCIYVNRKQKATIKEANENIATKAHFISNISAQITPSLQRLDSSQPDVKALLAFTEHVQTLSSLEAATGQPVELEELPVSPLCEDLTNRVKSQLKAGVTIGIDAPKMTARFNREYVSHILLHLLTNAAQHTPAGGHIQLDFKKRSTKKIQFVVSDTGNGIPEEERETIFKAFDSIKDLTHGDGLGLPICRQMALRMNGDLELDTTYTKGTRFILNIYA